MPASLSMVAIVSSSVALFPHGILIDAERRLAAGTAGAGAALMSVRQPVNPLTIPAVERSRVLFLCPRVGLQETCAGRRLGFGAGVNSGGTAPPVSRCC